MPTLLPHQEPAVEWLSQRSGGVLAVAPGLGKTIIAIAAARRRRLDAITVVCPLTLINTWRQEVARWWPDGDVHYRTYDNFQLHGLENAPKHVIFDESVLLKNRKALRTKRAFIERKRMATCWELSGSPTTRYIDDLWTQLHLTNPKKYTSYWRWTFEHCLTYAAHWGNHLTVIAGNHPGVEDRIKLESADEYYAYSYADFAHDYPDQAIPEWEIERREVPLSEDAWAIYSQMQKKFIADLPSGNRLLAPNELVKLLRLMQLTTGTWLVDDPPVSGPQAGGKLDSLWESIISVPGPTILWVNFIRTGEAVAATWKAPLLTGNTPTDERTRIVDEFQAGKHPLLIAHPGVGKFGLTLTRARSAIYIERSYDGDGYFQSLHRIRRLGTTEPPHVIHLLATGPAGQPTIDHLIDKALADRKDASIRLTTSTLRGFLDAA